MNRIKETLSSDESSHFLEGVRSASDRSPAGVTLPTCRGVVGDPLVVTLVTDDVALHDDQ